MVLHGWVPDDNLNAITIKIDDGKNALFVYNKFNLRVSNLRDLKKAHTSNSEKDPSLIPKQNLEELLTRHFWEFTR